MPTHTHSCMHTYMYYQLRWESFYFLSKVSKNLRDRELNPGLPMTVAAGARNSATAGAGARAGAAAGGRPPCSRALAASGRRPGGQPRSLRVSRRPPTEAQAAAAAEKQRQRESKWTHWDLNPGPSACEADVIPLHHVPDAHISSNKPRRTPLAACAQ